MDTEPSSELPHALGRIQLRTIGRQEVKAETIRLLLPPVLVESGVVIFRIVGNDHYPSIRVHADGAKILQELPASQGVKLVGLAPEEESTVAQANGSIIAHALPRGLMEEHGVPSFGRYPHPTTRTVLLKMHFVHGPQINRGIEA